MKSSHMEPFRIFKRFPTRNLILGCLVSIFAAAALETVESAAFQKLRIPRIALEFLSTTLFWVGYSALLLMIPISVFRPTHEFSVRGYCATRMKNTGITIGSAIVITLIAAFVVGRVL